MSSKVELQELINNDPLSERIVDLKVGDVLPIKDPKAIQKIKEVNESMLIGYALDINEEKMSIEKIRPTAAETLLRFYGLD
jgi:flagellar motor switch protein FliM|tara:strand:+ start:217 stop:459 length:243 start_codon:yes stop_codon:yes gene_type:complete